MPNILRIECRRNRTIDPSIAHDGTASFSAVYQERRYSLNTLFGIIVDDELAGAVFMFDPEDASCAEGGLDHVVLRTKFAGEYGAFGIRHISSKVFTSVQLYESGDDLEIIVDPVAERAIEIIKCCLQAAQKQMAGSSLPACPPGCNPSLN